MRHTLLHLGLPALQVQEYTDEVRRDQYKMDVSTISEQKVLAQMLAAVRGMEVAWRKCEAASAVVGMTIAEAELRRRFGLSLVAVIRGSEIISNPDAALVLLEGDTVCLLGTKEQLAKADALLACPPAQGENPD